MTGLSVVFSLAAAQLLTDSVEWLTQRAVLRVHSAPRGEPHMVTESVRDCRLLRG